MKEVGSAPGNEIHLIINGVIRQDLMEWADTWHGVEDLLPYEFRARTHSIHAGNKDNFTKKGFLSLVSLECALNVRETFVFPRNFLRQKCLREREKGGRRKQHISCGSYPKRRREARKNEKTFIIPIPPGLLSCGPLRGHAFAYICIH